MRLLPLLALATACRRPAAPAPLVLLVSWDTTRADALSCYGAPDARTPVADALAARGVRFAMALAASPTTLASHASLMSGLDTHGTRVVRNGFPVPGDVPLLAERLRDAGWDTLATVSAFPLEADMGLARGFRRYDDHAWLGWFGEYAVPADATVEAALDLLDDREPGRPVFLFVHFFDAHRPWTRAPDRVRARFAIPDPDGPIGTRPPDMRFLTDAAASGRLTADQARRARGLYLAEVAWNDENLGALLDGVAERGLDRDLLVVLFGDHGEVLDEIPERPYRHGPDVDLGATRVPLLVAGTGRFETPGGVVVDAAVRLQDVGATVLAAAGLDPALGDGRDLAPLWRGGAIPAAPAFMEATRPHEATAATGWPNAPLERGVALDGLLLTRAPWLGEAHLFRLAPDQPEVPAAEAGPAAARLGALLDAWDAGLDALEPGAADLDGATRRALEALGYLDPGEGG